MANKEGNNMENYQEHEHPSMECDSKFDEELPNTSIKEDDPTKKERFVCLLKKFPTPDWIKNESWESLPGNGLNEAMKFLTFDTEEKVDIDFEFLKLKPSLIDVPFELTLIHKIGEYKPISTPNDVIRIRVPVTDNQEIIDEDFLKSPVVQKCIELKNAEKTDAFSIQFPKGSYVVEDGVTKAKNGTD